MINLYELITTLTGSIRPVGETHTDTRRLDSLEDTIDLINRLMFDVAAVADGNKDRHEHSMKKAGQRAQRFIDDLKEATQ